MGSFSDHAKQGNQAGSGGSFQTRGAQIMAVADAIRPVLVEWLTGCKNKEGMPVQPSQIRAMALNVAQDIVKHAA